MVNPQGGEEASNPSQTPNIILNEWCDFTGSPGPGRKNHASHKPNQGEQEQVLRQRHQAEEEFSPCIDSCQVRENAQKHRTYVSRKLVSEVRRLDADVLNVEGASANLN